MLHIHLKTLAKWQITNPAFGLRYLDFIIQMIKEELRDDLQADEEIKPLPAWTNTTGYFVTDHGNVISLRKGSPFIMTPTSQSNGYHQVRLQADSGGQRALLIHRLVYFSFHPEGDPSLDDEKHVVVDHVDDNRQNNRLENLQLLSNRQNLIKSPNSKTRHTKEEIEELKRRYVEEGATTIELSREYDLCLATIRRHIKGLK